MPVGSSTVVAGLTVADSIVAPLDGLCEPLARLHVANGAVHGDTTSAISHTAETFASRELGIDRMRV